ncbi:hypothetical protein DH2020_008868 [Rehmannia glutinosa]|uniref:Plastid lipid-associated protein/fibrillin conserved domain-containing protein n=1 Tax=Rehmannia glutinosa TaxID=99300 RepID=A0ABR0X8D5_REHGL
MASMASVGQLTFKTFQNSSPNSKLIPSSSHFLVNRINFSAISITKSTKLKQNFAVRAAGEEENPFQGSLESDPFGGLFGSAEEKKPSEAVKEEKPSEAVTEEKPAEAVEEARSSNAVTEANPSDRGSLKRQLVESLAGTKRGLCASKDTKMEIVELIAQLELLNPNPAPTENLRRLNGKWVLAYTTFAGVFPLLASGVEEISQTIVSPDLTVEDAIKFAGPFTTTSVSVNAKFEVRTPMRVKVKFEEGVIGSPQLTDAIFIPDHVEFLWLKIDITPIRGVLTFIQDTSRSVFSKTISSQPPLKLPISYAKAESWLLTTYVDDELRIAKADGGDIFVLVKSGSPLFDSLPQN